MCRGKSKIAWIFNRDGWCLFYFDFLFIYFQSVFWRFSGDRKKKKTVAGKKKKWWMDAIHSTIHPRCNGQKITWNQPPWMADMRLELTINRCPNAGTTLLATSPAYPNIIGREWMDNVLDSPSNNNSAIPIWHSSNMQHHHKQNHSSESPGCSSRLHRILKAKATQWQPLHRQWKDSFGHEKRGECVTVVRNVDPDPDWDSVQIRTITTDFFLFKQETHEIAVI